MLEIPEFEILAGHCAFLTFKHIMKYLETSAISSLLVTMLSLLGGGGGVNI